MAISTMYPAMPGSPKTQLAADLAANGTSMTVSDASVLPDAPNICVIGDDATAEIVSYTTITGNVVSGLVRALGGTTASMWATGTDVARNYTSFDHDRFIENIQDLETNKLSAVNWGDIGGTLSSQTDLNTALGQKAPLASPALTGIPTAPTAADGTNTTQIGTTAFTTTAVNLTRDTMVTIVETLRGKKVSIIGDSITTYSGYLPTGYYSRYPDGTVTDVDQTWWMEMIKFSGATLEINASYRGSCSSNYKAGTSPGSGYIDYPDFYDRCNTNLLGNPDVIIIALGTNDSANSVAIGDFDYTTSYLSLSESTFATSYIKGIKTLQNIYPNAEIICVALAMKNAYATAIKDIAGNLGCAFAYAGDYRTESGSHPGASGMKEISLKVMTAGKMYADGSDTGWKTLEGTADNSEVFTGTINYRKIGSMVSFYAYHLKLKTDQTNVYRTIASGIFSDCKPVAQVPYPAGNSSKLGQIVISSSSGNLDFYKTTGETWDTNTYINFAGAFMTAS